jgi:type IX secretion system PorP/SprF family membrane protein
LLLYLTVDLNSDMSIIKKFLFIFVLSLSFYVSDGQETPVNPVSFRIFSPFIFNPAIAGSKDFFSVDLLASSQAKSYSQILSGNARLLKSAPGYTSSPKVREFAKIGLGGSVFNDLNGSSRNIGISLAGSYHFQLNKNALSFLSVGISVKGIYNQFAGDTDLGKPEETRMFPNLDVGLYYYDPNFFAGVSATNLLGNPGEPDSLGKFTIPVSRQYFFLAGYKFVISRPLNVVLEPSIIVTANDSLSQKITDMIKPGLKVYFGNFCLGTYFKDYSNIPFFFQYKYPRFYVGTFFELPRHTPFYKKGITAELAIGINLSGNGMGYRRNGHW